MGRVIPTKTKGAPKMNMTTIGIDLAKNVFQVHGVDDEGSWEIWTPPFERQSPSSE
jgi:hypothetical protein